MPGGPSGPHPELEKEKRREKTYQLSFQHSVLPPNIGSDPRLIGFIIGLRPAHRRVGMRRPWPRRRDLSNNGTLIQDFGESRSAARLLPLNLPRPTHVPGGDALGVESLLTDDTERHTDHGRSMIRRTPSASGGASDPRGAANHLDAQDSHSSSFRRLLNRLGREGEIEHLFQRLRVHAAPRVGDRYDDITTGFDTR